LLTVHQGVIRNSPQERYHIDVLDHVRVQEGFRVLARL
jgi:hypothetical protein